MIFNSTPSSITWGSEKNRRVTFHGEWTLEPKFYLAVPKSAYWDSVEPRVQLTEVELQQAINSLLADAMEKGWVIEIEN